jgi:hypothetical protein
VTCCAAAAAPPRGQPAAPLKLVEGRFIADGKDVNLHGINWFGFNAHATYLHGLWAGQASANSDFAAIAWQFRLLGFNAIRLPFLFADLWTPAEMIGGARLRNNSNTGLQRGPSCNQLGVHVLSTQTSHHTDNPTQCKCSC